MKNLINTLSPTSTLVRTGVVAAMVASLMVGCNSDGTTSSVGADGNTLSSVTEETTSNSDAKKNSNNNIYNISAEWYTRLTVSSPADGLKDSSNILGQLEDSTKGYDSHDLREMTPFSSPYLTIVFAHDDWKKDSGNYSSDYRNTKTDENMVTWDFSVKTDDASRIIALQYDTTLLDSTNSNKKQTNDFLDNMWLKNNSTGIYYKAYTKGEAKSLRFDMKGKNIKEFQWIHDKTGIIAKKYKSQKKQPMLALKEFKKQEQAEEREYNIIEKPPATE